ncbi:hypothetical protein EMIHUDRAFT_218779 [Emiliania huxleyi CCMP1516]|uniref:Uncharacterized protein n=2 Tax=Emiliania huxleyi TaxID=2903 RepID=A0A0D3I655_EMIH1|nr:hypothetical protein EMIHUDRAFT_218779 [Emiliania huxleyi CCMP1516]EOD06740.1 hypothetical protein EMIHUDRAFT_218779 [Emiliania huxleyi CCMP1516]|eukprot:XP_005759169.1 hypothetical protein EMIHUDRAFT_218779 [Emiliania huxleyi CCMP1516]
MLDSTFYSRAVENPPRRRHWSAVGAGLVVLLVTAAVSLTSRSASPQRLFMSDMIGCFAGFLEAQPGDGPALHSVLGLPGHMHGCLFGGGSGGEAPEDFNPSDELKPAASEPHPPLLSPPPPKGPEQAAEEAALQAGLSPTAAKAAVNAAADAIKMGLPSDEAAAVAEIAAQAAEKALERGYPEDIALLTGEAAAKAVESGAVSPDEAAYMAQAVAYTAQQAADAGWSPEEVASVARATGASMIAEALAHQEGADPSDAKNIAAATGGAVKAALDAGLSLEEAAAAGKAAYDAMSKVSDPSYEVAKPVSEAAADAIAKGMTPEEALALAMGAAAAAADALAEGIVPNELATEEAARAAEDKAIATAAVDDALAEAARSLPNSEPSCPSKEDLWSMVQLYHGEGETVPVTAEVWAGATWSLVSAKGVDVSESTYKAAAKMLFTSPAFEKDGDAFTDAGGLAACDALLKTVLCKDVAAAERSLPGGDGMTEEQKAAAEKAAEPEARSVASSEPSCPSKEDLWSMVQLYHGEGETVPVTAEAWAGATWSLVSAKGVDVSESTYKAAAKLQFASPAFEKDGDAFTDAGGLAACDALLKTVLCKDVAAAERSLPGGDGMTEEQKAAVEEKLEMAQYFGENPDSPLKAMVEQAIEDGVALVDAFDAALPAYEAMLDGATEEEMQAALDAALAEKAAEPEARSVASSEPSCPSKEDLWSMVQLYHGKGETVPVTAEAWAGATWSLVSAKGVDVSESTYKAAAKLQFASPAFEKDGDAFTDAGGLAACDALLKTVLCKAAEPEARSVASSEPSCPSKEDLWSMVQLYHGKGETVPVTAEAWAGATWSLVSAKGVDVSESTYKAAAKLQFASPAFEKDGDAFTDAGGLAACDALLKTVLCKDVAAAERSLPGGDGMTEEQKAAVEEKVEMAQYFGDVLNTPT